MGEPVHRQLPRSQDIVFCLLGNMPCIQGPQWPLMTIAYGLPICSVGGENCCLKGTLPLGMWGPESFLGKAGFALALSVDMRPLDVGQAPSACCLALWLLEKQPGSGV